MYENLYQISKELKNKTSNTVELAYKETNQELNELLLTFNRVARIIKLSNSSMVVNQTEEQLAQSLLSYADAFEIYNEFDRNHSQKGVCMANIGSIMF